ncbi:MAG: hypothetical protein IJS82_01625 [Paludibacteraceae bacterium]|nr:hypothetical protein [Paludibacteraceae bacterium]
MTRIDRIYSVRWFGPFETPEDVKRFEYKHKSMSFQLYILNGYKPYAKLYDSYYCGQTKRSVYQRLTDPNHHINEFRDISAIWIGSISNVEPKAEDINVAEKILTAQLRATFGERQMLNRTNKSFPKYNAYVVNIWHNPKENRLQRYQRGTIPADLPDVIGHEYEKLIDAHLLFSASKIKWVNVE